MTTCISNGNHYKKVVEKSLLVKRQLWIGTADIKDLYISNGLNHSQPYLAALNRLLLRNIEIKILCAKTPWGEFSE